MQREHGNNGAEVQKPRNVLDNLNRGEIADRIFGVLQTENPDKHGDELLTVAETAINEGNSTGLLYSLNAEEALDFGFFANETFSLDELSRLNINKIPGLETSDPLREAIEQAIISVIKSEFSHGLERDIAQKFREAISYYNTSLPELLNTVNNLFENQLNGEEKKKYREFKKGFNLSFNQIRAHLAPQIDPTTNQNLNENLNTKKFSERTESQQKSFDYLFSKLVLQRLKKRVEWVDSVAESATDTFALPLSLNILPRTEGYSCDYGELRTYAEEKDPENFQRLVETERALGTNPQEGQEGETENAEEQPSSNSSIEDLESIYREIYLKKIGETEPQVAKALETLYQNNFDYSSLNQDPSVRNTFLSKLASLRLEQLRKNNALEIFGNDTEQFEQFFNNLFDFSKNEIVVNGTTLHIEKELIGGGENPDFKELASFVNAKELPIRFKITGLENLNLNVDDQEMFDKVFQGDIKAETSAVPEGTPTTDGSPASAPAATETKTLTLENGKVGKLLLLYLMGQPSLVEKYDGAKAKKIENFFKNIDKDIALDPLKQQLNNQPENGGNPDETNPEQAPESQEDIKEEILRLRDELKGDSSPASDKGFGPGAILYCPIGESALPPRDESNKDRVKLYIKDVDWDRGTVKVRCNGVELKLPESEDMEIDVPLTVFKKNFLEKNNDLYGEPFKLLEPRKNFEKAYNDFRTHKLCRDDILGDAQFEDGKLKVRDRGLDGKEHFDEVQYFGSGLNVPDSEKVLYKVDWNNDGTVTVKSTSFLDSNNKPIEYRKKMSYPDFLVFLNEKKLYPKTSRMADEEKIQIKDIVSHKTSKIKWVSIHSLMYSMKTIWKNINDGLDKYQKKQDEACLKLLEKKGIYDGINRWTGRASPALSYSLSTAQDKAEEGQDKAVRGEIDEWLKQFSSLGDFANFFEKGEDAPTHQKFRILNSILKKNGFSTLKEVVSSGTFVGENDELRPIIAAAMIANIKKGKGLYRSLANQDNQALWLRCLFGPAHYQRYSLMRKRLEADIARSKGAKQKQLNDMLVNGETTYMINCIENSHGKDDYFGAPSDNNTQALKLVYSNEFASQLSAAVAEGTGEAAADNGYNSVKKFNLFNPVWKEVEKNITSGRIPTGIGDIEKLGEVAVDNDDFIHLNVAMTFVTLSGILNRREGKGMRTRFDGMARAYMLPTAFFGESNKNQNYAWYLLDKVPGGGFTEFMSQKGIKKEDFLKTSDNVKYKELFSALDEWRGKNSERVDRFFNSLKTNEQQDPILKEVSDVLWEEHPDSISAKWRAKPKITGHYALLASPEAIFKNKGYDRNGFTGDTDERNDKAEFWKSLLTSLKKAKESTDPRVDPKFFMKEFKLLFSNEGFGPSNCADNNRMLSMIKEVKEHTGPVTYELRGGEIEIPAGRYNPNDYSNLLWYMFKGKVLRNVSSTPPKEFDEVLDFFVQYFQDNFDVISSPGLLNEIFPTRGDDQPRRQLVPWQEYWANIQGEDPFSTTSDGDDEENMRAADTEQQKKGRRNWKKKNYKRQDLFYNAELAALDKALRNNGISTKNLTTDESSSGHAGGINMR